MASGINTALANAQGLQTRLFQKFGELKRPVISKAKSAQEVEDEERGLKSMQEKLNTLEKKLRIFRDLDTGKADERANVMTSLDGARRELLAAAREFEAYSFGSKDIIRSIMDFCQLKQAQADASPRSFKNSFKSVAPPNRRDDQPQQHADQNEKPSARRYSAGNNGHGMGEGANPSTPSVTVAPVPSHLTSSASKRYPPPPEKEQPQPSQPQPQEASLSSRLPRFPAADNNNINSSNNSNGSGISVAATAAAFSGLSSAVAPVLQKPPPGSLNIRVPSGLTRAHASNATSTTSSAANSANNVSAGSAANAAAATNIRTSNNSSSSGESAPAAPAASAAAATAAAAANGARGSTSSSSSLSRASSLPKAPGVPVPTAAAPPPPQQAAPAAPTAAVAAAKPRPLSTAAQADAARGTQSPPASSPLARVEGPPLSDHSPQMTQDSSMCNMESMCGAGTYLGTGGHSTTPTDPSATAAGEPSARLKALAQLHGQDTASSIPAPPPTAPQRPRMLDAYMAAASGSPPHQQQQPSRQQQQDLLQDQRGSELTLGHVIAKPSAVAAPGSLRPSQLLRENTTATTDASSSSGSSMRSATPSAASSLSLPATHAATHGLPSKDNKGPSAVTLKPAPVSERPEPSQEEEVEGSSTTPGHYRPTTHASNTQGSVADARVLSPALSSTYSSSPSNKQQGAGRPGAGGESAQEGGLGGAAAKEAEQQPGIADGPLSPDDWKLLERGKRAETTAAEVAAKRSTDSVGAAAPATPAAQPPGSSHVAKLQQRFLQTPQQRQQQQREREPATPCTDSVLGMLRNSSQQQQQQGQRQCRENSEGVSMGGDGGGARLEKDATCADGVEATWEVEAQRTTARAPPPRTQQLDRSSVVSHTHPAHAMHLQTPSSRMAATAAADRKLVPPQGPGVAATPSSSHLAPPAQHLGLPQYDGRAAAAAEAVPAEQQLLLQQQYRAAAAAAATHSRSGGGGAGAVPPPSVLAAGPQLVAAGLVSVPPAFASRPTMRACEAWETEGEEDEVVQEQQALLQMQAMEALLHQHGHGKSLDGTYSRRHTAPDPVLMERLQQQLCVRAPRSVPAHSRGPSTPSPASCYVGGGRKKKRGVWGGILRVLGITTTVASVVVVTGAAVFAAAALNTGLDELDLMHPEASTPISSSSRGPFKSKVQRAKCPQGSSMRHPDALAAGRG